MSVKLSSALVACAIAIASSPSFAQQINRMPDNVKADIYKRVCLANKNHGLSNEQMLQYTENWLTRNADFEPLSSSLSDRERKEIKDARKVVILRQANEMLSKAMVDNDCSLARY